MNSHRHSIPRVDPPPPRPSERIVKSLLYKWAKVRFVSRRYSLGQKKVSEDEFDRHGDAAIRRRDPKEVGRLNRLVPYLDLFERLEDRELARLANVPERTVLRMRDQVKSVRRKLHPYVGLLDRLDDLQLARSPNLDAWNSGTHDHRSSAASS